MADSNIVRALVDLRDRTLQKNRIAFGNRINAVENGKDSSDPNTQKLLKKYFNTFQQLENQLDIDLKEIVSEYPIVQEVTKIKGIASTLACKLVSTIDITKADTVSALWRYAGYAVIDGEREKPVAGERIHYNKRLKTTCYLIGTSFLKCKSPYAQLYYNAKEYYENSHPDWTPMHRHRAAMRKMIKVFLAHLWEHWREMERLEIRPVYPIEKLGHNHIIDRFDYGWKRN